MARHAARKGALALPPLPDDAAGLVAPTRAPLVLGSTANPARAPLKEKLGEREPAGIRAGFVALAPVGAALFLGLLALHLVAAEGDFVMAGRVLAAAVGLLMFAGGLFRFGLISHFLTGMAFTVLGLFSLGAFSMDPSVLPAVGFIASVLAVDYVWSVRKRLRTGEMRSFDRLLRPFRHATPLRGAAPQNALIELNNQIAAAGSIRAVIPEDVLAIEAMHRVRIPHDLPGETRILYARYLRHFLEDDFLDDGEKEEIAALERLLRLPPAVRASVRKAIAAWLYKVRAREAMRDGRLEDHERALLDRIAADLELPARDAERIFRTHAKALAKAAARDDRADGVLAGADVAEPKDMAAHPAIPIGDGIGGIGRATLERHRQGRAHPDGRRAVADVFILLPGEVVHFETSAELRREESPGADPGTVRVTSRRLRFAGAAVREEVPLDQIEGIRPCADAVEIQQALGPARFYSFPHNPAEADLFVQILSHAMRAASAGERP